MKTSEQTLNDYIKQMTILRYEYCSICFTYIENNLSIYKFSDSRCDQCLKMYGKYD